LTVAPAPEIGRLRGQALALGEREPDGGVRRLAGEALEIYVEFDLTSGNACGIAVRCSEDGTEQTLISFNRSLGELTVDRNRSSALSDMTGLSLQVIPFKQVHGDRLRLTVFVDHSVLEVFVHGGPCVTSRMYPSKRDSVGVRVYMDNQVKLRELQAWTLDER
jgi:beta-fructofuranosidase